MKLLGTDRSRLFCFLYGSALILIPSPWAVTSCMEYIERTSRGARHCRDRSKIYIHTDGCTDILYVHAAYRGATGATALCSYLGTYPSR